MADTFEWHQGYQREAGPESRGPQLSTGEPAGLPVGGDEQQKYNMTNGEWTTFNNVRERLTNSHIFPIDGKIIEVLKLPHIDWNGGKAYNKLKKLYGAGKDLRDPSLTRAFTCDYDCGFIGTSYEVADHEETCPNRLDEAGEAVDEAGWGKAHKQHAAVEGRLIELEEKAERVKAGVGDTRKQEIQRRERRKRDKSTGDKTASVVGEAGDRGGGAAMATTLGTGLDESVAVVTPPQPKVPSEDFDFVAEITTELVVGRRIRLNLGAEGSDKSSWDWRVTGTIMEIVPGSSPQLNKYRIEVDKDEATKYNKSYFATILVPIPFGFEFHRKELVHPWMRFYRDALASHFSRGQSDSQWENKYPNLDVARAVLTRARFEHNEIVGRNVLVDMDIPRVLIRRGGIDTVALLEERGEDGGVSGEREKQLSIYNHKEYDNLTDWEDHEENVQFDSPREDLERAHSVVMVARRETLILAEWEELNAIDKHVSNKIAEEIIKRYGRKQLREKGYKEFTKKYRQYK